MIENYNFEILEDTIKIYFCNVSFKNDIMGYLIPILYNSNFFNVSQDNTELSLFVSSKVDLSLLSFLNCDNEEYNIIKINQNYHQINDVGVVSEISKFFSSINIPILYVNSFNNNYILIPRKHIDKIENHFIHY